MTDCIFCKIIDKKLPSKIVFENSDVIVFENINPVATTHLLICPKKHIKSFLDMGTDFSLDKMTEAAKIVIKERKIEDGYKLIFNGGKYQSVSHLHWHVLGGNLEDPDDILNKL